MNILEFLFGKKNEEVAVEAPPIEINPTTENQFKRNVYRLRTLMLAVEQGDYRREVLDEIEQRKKAVQRFGHSIPNSFEEIESLVEKVSK